MGMIVALSCWALERVPPGSGRRTWRMRHRKYHIDKIDAVLYQERHYVKEGVWEEMLEMEV